MKKLSVLLIITFLAGIVLPLVFANRKSGAISKEENRYLADFPVFYEGNHFNRGIRDGFEDWINDNAGGREMAVIVNKAIQFNLFGAYPDPRVLIENRRWMYIIYDRDWISYLNPSPFTVKEIAEYDSKLARITKNLNDHAIEFMVVLWPYKHDIYPENIRGYKPAPGYKVPLLQLDDKLGSSQNYDFSTAYIELLEAKEDHLVYSILKDRYHWNNTGARVGYEFLMLNAAKHLPGLKILEDDEYAISAAELTTSYPWGLSTTEPDLEYHLRSQRRAVQDPEFFNRINFRTHDPWKAYKYFNNPDDSLPSAIVIGDSYINGYFIDDMAESFYELVFIDQFDEPMVPKLIASINPDIIICAGLGSESLNHFVKLDSYLEK